VKGSRGLQRTHSRAGSKVREKVAEVIEAEGEDSRLHEAASERTAVSEAVMERIRKALALGLHQGGNIAERQHAMQRATRLMQQYGITHAGTALFRGGHMHCNLPSAGMLCTGSTSGYLDIQLLRAVDFGMEICSMLLVKNQMPCDSQDNSPLAL
jgi:hypothetical protein